MNLNWSLKELYTSFNSEEFLEDMECLTEVIDEINKWTEIIVKDTDCAKVKLEGYVERFSVLADLITKIGSFIELSISVNTKDDEALKYSDILEKKLTKIVEAETKLNKWISSIENIDEVIKDSILLKDHEFILKEVVEKSKYLLTDREEAIIANMQNTGSNAWGKLKDNLISTHKVEINEDGKIKEYPLTVVLNMAYDKDEKVRKRAYEAEIASYTKIEEGVAAALNGIKGEVLTICEFRGYKSPLEQTLINSRMDEESLNVMLEAMKESMPKFREYLKRKAEILGHKNGLPFYDMYAPIVESDMEFDYEKGKKFVVDKFRTFSDNLANFAQKAMNNNWIDVMPKEGKVGGAFCAGIHYLGESRILLNYGNSFSDVVTMAHELGHGFHGECLKDESVLNTEYPMPIAETASTFCETIVKKAAIKEADKITALAILESEISDCNQVIVDIYSRFLFEKSLFEARKESALTVDQIKKLMLDAQREAYGDGLDPEYLHPYMWTWKPHYYYANSNFYNFPYAFGNLFALGLYSKFLEEGQSFVPKYKAMLSATPTCTIEEAGAMVGIDLTKKEFWASSLALIEKNIEQFCEMEQMKWRKK